MSANVVLRHSVAVSVRDTEVGLRRGEALIRGLSVPRDRLRVVLTDAIAEQIRQLAEASEGAEMSCGIWGIAYHMGLRFDCSRSRLIALGRLWLRLV